MSKYSDEYLLSIAPSERIDFDYSSYQERQHGAHRLRLTSESVSISHVSPGWKVLFHPENGFLSEIRLLDTLVDPDYEEEVRHRIAVEWTTDLAEAIAVSGRSDILQRYAGLNGSEVLSVRTLGFSSAATTFSEKYPAIAAIEKMLSRESVTSAGCL